jgi:hypothetical protein
MLMESPRHFPAFLTGIKPSVTMKWLRSNGRFPEPLTHKQLATIQGRRPKPPIHPEKYGSESLRHETQETSEEQQPQRSVGFDHGKVAQTRHIRREEIITPLCCYDTTEARL